MFRNSTVHVIDFEGSTECGIVEYGVVTLSQGVLTQTATRLCAPQATIRSRDSQLHGIAHADTTGLAPFTDEWEFFSQLRKTGPLVAHHASVENRFLKQAWPYPPQSPDFIHLGEKQATWGPWIDTCQLYNTLYPALKSYKLADLVHTFQLQQELDALAQKHCTPKRNKYHCALYDALASALLLLHVCNLSGYEGVTLPWLIINSSNSSGQGELRFNPQS